mgnify:FL=1
MKETKDSVISAALIDGKHLHCKVDVSVNGEGLAKMLSSLVYAIVQGVKESQEKAGVPSALASKAAWAFIGCAIDTARYDKDFIRSMEDDDEDEDEDEDEVTSLKGLKIIAIGDDEAIPDKWPKALKELVRELREQERGEN